MTVWAEIGAVLRISSRVASYDIYPRMAKKSSLRSSLERHIKTHPQKRASKEAGKPPKKPSPSSLLFKWPAIKTSRGPIDEENEEEVAATREGRWSRTIFSKHIPVVTVGDGDFSFSASLLSLGVPVAAATVYDSLADAAAKYPNTAQHLASLRAASVPVLDSIDGRTCDFVKLLKRTPPNTAAPTCPLVYVVWNFPHADHGVADQAHALRKSQELLVRFFANPSLAKSSSNVASTILPRLVTVNNAAEEIPTVSDSFLAFPMTGCDGEGSPRAPEFALVLTVWSGAPYDAWDVKRLAHSQGWRTAYSFDINMSAFPHYRHVVTKRLGSMEARGTSAASFQDRASRTYVFVRQQPQ